MKKSNIKKLAIMGMLVALAYVSLWVIRIPIIPSAGFLRYDVKDVFVCIGGLICGPAYAIGAAICISFIQMLTVSEYGVIGLIMNIFSVVAYSGVVSLIYSRHGTKKNLIISLFSGLISVTVVMILWNYLITPLYMGVSREAVGKMIIPAILPFNLIKSILNSIWIFIIYSALGTVIKKIVESE